MATVDNASMRRRKGPRGHRWCSVSAPMHLGHVATLRITVTHEVATTGRWSKGAVPCKTAASHTSTGRLGSDAFHRAEYVDMGIDHTLALGFVNLERPHAALGCPAGDDAVVARHHVDAEARSRHRRHSSV